MRFKTLSKAAALAALSCSAAAAAAAPPSAPADLRARTTISGQPIPSPPAGFEIVLPIRDIPAGGALPAHKHLWPRYVYVERGRIRVINEEAGLQRDFAAGELIVEAVEQWHEGRVIGDEPVRLIVLDQVPRGKTNMILKNPK